MDKSFVSANNALQNISTIREKYHFWPSLIPSSSLMQNKEPEKNMGNLNKGLSVLTDALHDGVLLLKIHLIV
jgi:hypothetical protein